MTTEDRRTRRLRELLETWRGYARSNDEAELRIYGYCADELAAVLDTEGDRRPDPLANMRAAKYLNPSCAEDGCQWLQAESRKNVVRADVAVLLRADLLDALPQGPSLTRLRAFVNEGLQRTVLPQDTKND